MEATPKDFVISLQFFLDSATTLKLQLFGEVKLKHNSSRHNCIRPITGISNIASEYRLN